MKSPYLLPAATAVIGFSIAWFAKPGGTPVTPPAGAAKTGEISQARPARPNSQPRPTAADGKRPAEVKASDFPLADQFEQGPKTLEEAKMLRLSEALGLSVDQQGAIISLIEKVQATASDKGGVIDDLATRGKAVEEGLKELLTPEQLAKFQQVRERARENLSELRAQQDFKSALEEIDLSPEQKEDVLNRLRQKSKADLQAIPAAATLLFDKSILPTGNKELSVDGVLLLAQIGQEVSFGDPMVARQKVIDRQRSELERLLECFDGILTPAQMGQYQATIAEQRAIMQRLPGRGSKTNGVSSEGQEASDPPGNP